MSESPQGNGFAEAHRRVCDLVGHFEARREEVTASDYKEASARAEFITPFFEALGWDVNNAAHRTIYEKECVLEKAEAVGGSRRSADYAFRKPGTHLTAFFVEAKKPSIDIQNHEDCYQAVRYGWNASTPLVVLTDFEQFLILDARIRPDKQNATSHILRSNGSYSLRDYSEVDKFTELWGLFSRQAVANGSLEKAAAALPALSGRIHRDDLFARGTRPVDDEFLAQMELWRERFAKSLKRRNHALDGDRLTAITQRVLDRLVFLRFLEDRGVERDVTYAELSKSGSAWSDFLRISKRLDARYNGIIYKTDRDGCEDPTIEVDDVVFAEVVEGLDPHNSDYLFQSIPVTILGSIYERFLGNVIVAKEKTAVVEPKPEVRKAGGVYYTPDFIVAYIVEQTVGARIDRRTPNEIEKLRFADIACGSGSFLVEVFAHLIRYHLSWYLTDGTEKWEKKRVIRKRELDGDYVLTLSEKRRILLANIHGVDLDPQAVEVTQLSLYLRLMEDESFPSTQSLFDFEKHALLPDLRENVICGNSLIETDIADLFGLSPSEEEKLRPLDFRWHFPKVFATPGAGFNAIVGNPPYVRMEAFKEIKSYLATHYSVHEERADIYSYFLERAVQLLRPGERLGYIVSNKFLRAKYGKPLRALLSETVQFDRIVDFAGLPVFHGATVRTVVMIASRKALPKKYSFEYTPPPSERTFRRIEAHSLPLDAITRERAYNIESPELGPEPWALAPPESSRMLERIRAGATDLGVAYAGLVGMGIKSGLTEAFVVSAKERAALISHNKRCAEHLKPFINGRDVRRYRVEAVDDFLIYAFHGVDLSEAPELLDHMRPFRARLEARATKQKWYELQQPQLRYASLLDRPKIVFPDMAIAPRFALDERGRYCSNTCYFIASSDKYLLALLNSSLGYYYFRQVCAGLEGKGETYLRFFGQYLESFPVHLPRAADRELKAKIVRLVDKRIAAETGRSEAVDGARREHWARQSEALDRQIDSVVNQLYGLTDDEIAIIEEPTRTS